MRVKPHSHPCQSCGAKTPCPGTWEENYDGWPEVICREFHLESGILNPDFFCSGCACVDCGERATTWAKHYTWPDTYVDEKVCECCAEKRDNYEPPDPDGEDIFRDYRAEERDSLDAARRLK